MSATTIQTANPGGFTDSQLRTISNFVETQRRGGHQSGTQSDTNLLFQYLLAIHDSYLALQEQLAAAPDSGGNVVGDSSEVAGLQDQIQLLTSKLEAASKQAIGSIPSQQEILASIPLQELASAAIGRLVGLVESSNIISELNQQALARMTNTANDQEPIIGVLGDPSETSTPIAPPPVLVEAPAPEPEAPKATTRTVTATVVASKPTPEPKPSASVTKGKAAIWMSAPDAWRTLGGRADKEGTITGEDGSAIAFKTFRQQSDAAFAKRFPTKIKSVSESRRKNGEPWIAMA